MFAFAKTSEHITSLKKQFNFDDLVHDFNNNRYSHRQPSKYTYVFTLKLKMAFLSTAINCIKGVML